MWIKQEITQAVIDALKQGEIPWQKWTSASFPMHFATQSRVFGVNGILLNMHACQNEFRCPYWATLTELEILGKQIKPGSKPCKIVLYKAGGDGKIYLTYRTAFNLEQTQGFTKVDPEALSGWEHYHRAKKIIADTGAKIEYVGYWPMYSRSEDCIYVPALATFMANSFGPTTFYETVFHELAHWSESRLGVDFWSDENDNAEGPSRASAKNELRAEIITSFLTLEAGLQHSAERTNHDRFKDYWIKLLESDPNLIFSVAASATDGVDFIVKNPKRFNKVPHEYV